jgi:hypothetical protein
MLVGQHLCSAVVQCSAVQCSSAVQCRWGSTLRQRDSWAQTAIRSATAASASSHRLVLHWAGEHKSYLSVSQIVLVSCTNRICQSNLHQQHQQLQPTPGDPVLQVDRLHVFLQALRQGEPLVALAAGVRQLLLVDDLDVAPEGRGLVEVPAGGGDTTHHIALLVKRLVTLGAKELLRIELVFPPARPRPTCDFSCMDLTCVAREEGAVNFWSQYGQYGWGGTD